MSNRFYMMCLRETVGNNASFHCHNGNGYSSDIDRAHVYTQEEAQKAWNCGRDIDQPVCADKRIMFREYDRLIITKGYPKRDDSSRRIDVPYGGYEIKTITHPHFGDKPVKVFAIKVNIDG